MMRGEKAKCDDGCTTIRLYDGSHRCIQCFRLYLAADLCGQCEHSQTDEQVAVDAEPTPAQSDTIRDLLMKVQVLEVKLKQRGN